MRFEFLRALGSNYHGRTGRRSPESKPADLVCVCIMVIDYHPANLSFRQLDTTYPIVSYRASHDIVTGRDGNRATRTGKYIGPV